MPISFNEPLSFLQRVTEYLEYSKLLFQAARSDDPVQRLEYIAALVVSGASSNWDRLSKPFNPLQGETYELDRTRDLGFRAVCEQVSHHPPTSAYHAEAADGSWLFHGSVSPKLSFWGKTVDVAPKGVNVPCKVHNILFGKLWVEHCGDVTITNHRTGHRCELRWHQSSWFSLRLSPDHRLHLRREGPEAEGAVRQMACPPTRGASSSVEAIADDARIPKSADDDDDDQPVSASSAGPDNNGSGVDKSGLRSSQSDRSLAPQPASPTPSTPPTAPRTTSRQAAVPIPTCTCLARPACAPAAAARRLREILQFHRLRHGFKRRHGCGAAARDCRQLTVAGDRTCARWRMRQRAGAVGEGPAGGKAAAGVETGRRLEARRLWFKQWRNPHSGSKEADWLFLWRLLGPGLDPLRRYFLMVDALWFVNGLTVWMSSFFPETPVI
uniref:Oxysterol-binding protein n=1 Tax=Macrostomum lignano TaxID=282301 RepID=A0A1I8FSC3_9PLAT